MPTNGSFRLLSIIGSVIIALAGAFAIINAYVGPLQLEVRTLQTQVISHTKTLGDVNASAERILAADTRVTRLEAELKQRMHDLDIKIQTEIKGVSDLSTARDKELDVRLQAELAAIKTILAERIVHAESNSAQRASFGKEARQDLLERLVAVSNRLDAGLRDVENKSAEQVRTTNALMQLEVRKLDEKLQREMSILQEQIRTFQRSTNIEEHVRRLAEEQRHLESLMRILETYIAKIAPPPK